MSGKTAYLVGAGGFCADGFHPGAGDIVIAADGGFDALQKAGLRADLVLGDMDSIRRLPRGVARLRFPAKKDSTDMALGLALAKGRGFRRFKLYGALGGRMDHSLANLHLLAGLASQGLGGIIIAPDCLVLSARDGSLRLPLLPAGTLVSVFSWGGPARGVSLRGLKYGLKDAILNADEPLGVSNEATGRPAQVQVASGTLVIVINR